jgi:hypothetical protein
MVGKQEVIKTGVEEIKRRSPSLQTHSNPSATYKVPRIRMVL